LYCCYFKLVLREHWFLYYVNDWKPLQSTLRGSRDVAITLSVINNFYCCYFNLVLRQHWFLYYVNDWKPLQSTLRDSRDVAITLSVINNCFNNAATFTFPFSFNCSQWNSPISRILFWQSLCDSCIRLPCTLLQCFYSFLM
jgi:hypothetical protein